MENTINIGTRASNLALAQATIVQNTLLTLFPNLETRIVKIKTTGDIRREDNLADIGGKGVFIKELEEQLLAKEIDIAVHSMKDMPAQSHPDLCIATMLKREAPNDVLLTKNGSTLSELKEGAVIGTSSPRRAAQLLAIRPDLTIIPFRGNVGTRIQKLHNNDVDATLLALAGLRRLDIDYARIAHPFETHDMVPAIGQGAIGIQCRASDTHTLDHITPLDDPDTSTCVCAERIFLQQFGNGSCNTPIAALAQLTEEDTTLIRFTGLIASTDGTRLARETIQTNSKDAKHDISMLAAKLLREVGEDVFE